MLPGKDITEEVREFTRSRHSSVIPPASTDDSPFALPTPHTLSSSASIASPASRLDEDYVTTLDKMHRLHIKINEADVIAANVRYSGPSSSAMLVVKAMSIRSLSNHLASRDTPAHSYLRIRPDLWSNEPWELKAGSTPYPSSFVFPPSDLMSLWVNKYFEEVNAYFPVLHRPTFDRLLFGEHLHLRDEAFASTVLAVCSIGEKRAGSFVGIETERLRGWLWFNQIQDRRLGYLALPGLFDLQRHAVSFFVHLLGRLNDESVVQAECNLFVAMSIS